MTALIVLLYGILVAAGGVMGYVKAGSIASLISGGGAGLILLGASVAMMRGSYSLGWWISLLVALLLLGRFGMAAMNDFKLMPGGMVIAMSLLVLAVLLFNRTR
jgi:uncharacterized membrane protein (UPF0136 family)